MATHYSGEAAVVKVGSVTIGEGLDWSVTSTAEVIDDTALLDTWKTSLPGKKSWSGSMNCHWDETNTTGQGAVTVGAAVTLNLYPEGATTGDIYFTGAAVITSVGVTVAEGWTIKTAIAFQGNGSLTQSTAA